MTSRFFSAVHRRQYREAYEYLSPAVRRDLSFENFAARSEEVKSVKVLEMRVTDRSRNLVRYCVKGRLRLVYQGELFDAVYAGQASISLSKGRWYIDEVDLKPTSQKKVRAPEYHI